MGTGGLLKGLRGGPRGHLEREWIKLVERRGRASDRTWRARTRAGQSKRWRGSEKEDDTGFGTV